MLNHRNPYAIAFLVAAMIFASAGILFGVAVVANFRDAVTRIDGGGIDRLLSDPTITLFPSPREIRRGQRVDLQTEISHLHSIGYRESPQATPGTYKVFSDQIVITSRLPEIAGAGVYFVDGRVQRIVKADNPAADVLEIEQEPLETFIRDAGGKLVPVNYLSRGWAAFRDTPLADAVILREDRNFWVQPDIPQTGLIRALYDGGQAGGGGGLIAQLARGRLVERARTYSRKWRELGIASALNSRLSRTQIAELYFDKVPMGAARSGRPIIGYAAAARYLMGAREPADLSLSQAATLAVLTSRPSFYERVLTRPAETNAAAPPPARWRRFLPAWITRRVQPRRRETAAEARAHLLRFRNELLNAMNEAFPQKYPSDVIAAAKREQLGLPGWNQVNEEALLAGHFIDYITERGIPIETGRVHTSLDVDLQRLAVRSLRNRLSEMADRIGLPDGGSKLQGSVIAIEPRTGAVLVLAGGRMPRRGTLIRAVESPRSAGSATLKIFLFAWAVDLVKDRSVNSMTMINGTSDAVEGDWRPPHHCGGLATIYEHIKTSANCPPVVIASWIGLSHVRSLFTELLHTTPDRAHPLMVLGGEKNSEVRMMDLALAYGAVANGGLLWEPRLITALANGPSRLEIPSTSPRRVFSETAAFLAFDLMTAPMQPGGTAGSALERMHLPPGLSAVGKTGTGQRSDAVFVSILDNRDLLILAHAGMDDMSKLSMDEGFQGAALIPVVAEVFRGAQEVRPKYFMPKVAPIPNGLIAIDVDTVHACAAQAAGIRTYQFANTSLPMCAPRLNDNESRQPRGKVRPRRFRARTLSQPPKRPRVPGQVRRHGN